MEESEDRLKDTMIKIKHAEVEETIRVEGATLLSSWRCKRVDANGRFYYYQVLEFDSLVELHVLGDTRFSGGELLLTGFHRASPF